MDPGHEGDVHEAPAAAEGGVFPGRIQFQIEKHKKLLRRKLDPGIQKHIENPKLHNFRFSVCFWIPGFNFRLSNFIMFFNMKLNRARSQAKPGPSKLGRPHLALS